MIWIESAICMYNLPFFLANMAASLNCFCLCNNNVNCLSYLLGVVVGGAALLGLGVGALLEDCEGAGLGLLRAGRDWK